MIRHRYDERMQCDVLDVGPRTYPLKEWHHSDSYSEHPVRQAIVQFENRWALSIVWSALTYGDNYHFGFGRWRDNDGPAEFVEEPQQVEVGVLSPKPRILPGLDRETAAYLQTQYPTNPEAVAYMMEDRPTDLACDPFGWLDAAAVNQLADAVMKLPSHPDDVTALGKELEQEAWRGPALDER